MSTPTFHAEAGFGALAADPIIPWTDVTDRFLSINGNRGRNTELERVEAGTATIDFDNADGVWTPGREWVATASESFANLADPDPAANWLTNTETGLSWTSFSDGAGSFVSLAPLAAGGVRADYTEGNAKVQGFQDADGINGGVFVPGQTYRVTAVVRGPAGDDLALSVYQFTDAGSFDFVDTAAETVAAASGRWEARTVEFVAPSEWLLIVAWSAGAWVEVRSIEAATPNPWAGKFDAGTPIRTYTVVDDNLLHFEAVNPLDGPGAPVRRWHGAGPVYANGGAYAESDSDGPFFSFSARQDTGAPMTMVVRGGVPGNADLIQVQPGDTVTVSADMFGANDLGASQYVSFEAGGPDGVPVLVDTSTGVLSTFDDAWHSLSYAWTVPAWATWVRPVFYIPDATWEHIRFKNVKVRKNGVGSATVAPYSGTYPTFRGVVERWTAGQAGNLATLTAEAVDALGQLSTEAPSLYRMVADYHAATVADNGADAPGYHWPLVEDGEATEAHASFGEVAAVVGVSTTPPAAYGFVSGSVVPFGDGTSSGGFSPGGQDINQGAIAQGKGFMVGPGAWLEIHGPTVPTVVDDDGFEVRFWLTLSSLPADSSSAASGGSVGDTDGRVLVSVYGLREGAQQMIGKLEFSSNPGDDGATLIGWWRQINNGTPSSVPWWSVNGPAHTLTVGVPHLIRFGVSMRYGGTQALFCGVDEGVSVALISNPTTVVGGTPGPGTPQRLQPLATGVNGAAPTCRIFVGCDPLGSFSSLAGTQAGFYSGAPDGVISNLSMLPAQPGLPFWWDAFRRTPATGLGAPDGVGSVTYSGNPAASPNPVYTPETAARFRVNNWRLEADPLGNAATTGNRLWLGNAETSYGPHNFGGKFRIGAKTSAALTAAGNITLSLTNRDAFASPGTGDNRTTVTLRLNADGSVQAGSTFYTTNYGLATLTDYWTGAQLVNDTGAVWFKFAVVGKVAKVAAWRDGDPEPPPWWWGRMLDMEFTTNGVGSYSVSGSGVIRLDFSVGTAAASGTFPVWLDGLAIWGGAFAVDAVTFTPQIADLIDAGSWVASEVDRFNRILGAEGVNWQAGTAFDPGLSQLMPAQWDAGTAWSTIIQDAAESAGGVAIGGPAGEIAYHNRRRISPFPRWTLGEHVDLAWTYDLEKVRNVVTAQRSTGASRVARNPESIARYGQRAVTITRDVNDVRELEDAATWYANTYPVAVPWCDRITVQGTTAESDPELLALSLGAATGDFLRMYGLGSAAPDGVVDAIVEGVNFTATLNGGVVEWSASLAVSPALASVWGLCWVIEDPTTGALDTEQCTLTY